MRASVGKPTLRVDKTKALAKLIQIKFLPRGSDANRLGERKSVPGPNHCRDPFLALSRIRRVIGEGPDPTPLREPQRGVYRRLVRMGRCIRAIRRVDAGLAQLIGKPAFAVAAGAQRSRFGECVGRVIDQPEFREPIGERFQVRGAVTLPSALADLAVEILAKLGARRRIFADIAKRDLTQVLAIQRRSRATGRVPGLHA